MWCLPQYCCTNNSLSVYCVAATESSETSSQCTSSDSVTGLSTITIPAHQGNVMDSYNNNDSSSFLCSSTPPSSNASPLIFQKEEDLQSPSTKFITAVSVDCLPSYLLMLRTCSLSRANIMFFQHTTLHMPLNRGSIFALSVTHSCLALVNLMKYFCFCFVFLIPLLFLSQNIHFYKFVKIYLLSLN